MTRGKVLGDVRSIASLVEKNIDVKAATHLISSHTDKIEPANLKSHLHLKSMKK